MDRTQDPEAALTGPLGSMQFAGAVLQGSHLRPVGEDSRDAYSGARAAVVPRQT